MIKSVLLCLLLMTSLPLFAWQENTELVYTATLHLEKAQEFMEVKQYDSALVYCDWAREKAPSYREVYIVKHKVYEAMKMETSKKIENLKAGQKVSLEDEELAYYLAQVFQKASQTQEAVLEYTNAIEYSKAHDGDVQFRYFYYSGRGTVHLKSREYEKAIADFTLALEIDPESTAALINRGFCFYNSKDKEKACKDWQKATKLGNKTAENYNAQYCY